MPKSNRVTRIAPDPFKVLPARQREIQARCRHPSGDFTPFPARALEGSIPERFESQVRLHPRRPALKTQDGELTYEELNRAANRLAHRLVAELGEAPDTVALLIQPGAMQIVAIIAALKAGKVYLPLDPYYPRARLRHLLADAGARLVLASTSIQPLAAEIAGPRTVITVDAPRPELSPENLEHDIHAGDTAFIHYTSGSTGTPKGCPYTHRNVLHDVRNYTNTGRFCPQDRFLLVSSFSFADSVRTLYGSLLNGALLCPFDIRGLGVSPLAAWMRDAGVTIYRSTATVYRHFVSTLPRGENFPELRLIYLGAEPVYREDFERYRTHFPDECIFVNRVGTSETMTYRWYFMDKSTRIEGVHVPVGYPAPDMEVVLLEPEPPAPDGSQVGEIGVRSKYLPEGYWKAPALTQAAFLEAADGGLRTYCTGDLGRMLPDGCLVHLGRKDFQVKVRGHRIEPAEIEHALAGHSAVKEAVVASLLDGPPGAADTRLVAYLTLHDGPAPTATAWRRFLAERLPEFMIPAVFMALDALPLTASGKLDRRALPAPEVGRPDLDSPYEGPRNPVEAGVAAIWAQVLNLPQVGIHDPFLELGGDSLSATGIVSRVTHAFGVEVPMRALLERPTVAQMAALISEWSAPAPNAPSD